MNSNFPIARFMSKVSQQDGRECWIWLAAKNEAGYGVFSWGVERLAHRAAYVMLKEPIPPGLVVRHRCDNPACVNPDHLVAGTQTDNMNDAIERDRFPKGEDHHSLKLNEQKVREILSSTEPAKVLAQRYGVSVDYVSMIQRGVRWGHVKMNHLPDRIRRKREFGRYGEGHHGTSLTEADVVGILSDSRTNKEVAATFGTSATTVSNIKNGKTWRNVARP